MDLIRHVYMNRFLVANLFDEFIRQATLFYERPAHTIQEMRARQSTKARGDMTVSMRIALEHKRPLGDWNNFFWGATVWATNLCKTCSRLVSRGRERHLRKKTRSGERKRRHRNEASAVH